MKKLFNLFAAALAIVATASCQEELTPTPDVTSKVVKTFSMAIDNADTKTALTIDTATNKGKVTWVAGDEITIFDGAENATVVLTADDIDAEDASIASFTAEVAEADTYYAVYPANSASSISTAVVSLMEQSGKFEDVSVMAAASTGDSFTFQNIFGLIKFETNKTDVCQLTLKGANSETFAGSVKLNFDASGVASTTMGDPFWGFIVNLNYTAGTYYIATPAIDLTAGFTLDLYSDEGHTKVGSVVASRELVVSAGKIINLGNIDGRVAHYITNAEELKAFLAYAPNAAAGETWYFANDIDLEGVEITSATSFNGTLDGQNYKIKNWECNGPLITITGTDKTALIKNIIVDETCTMNAVPGNFATLVGRLYGNIENCENHASATVVNSESTQYMMGGLVSRLEGKATNCKNYGNFTFTLSNSTAETTKAPTNYIGGIAGFFGTPQTGARFENCVNEGNISVTINGSLDGTTSRLGHQYLGGIVGASAVNSGASDKLSGYIKNYGVIKDCENKGSISLNRPDGGANMYPQLGGIVGYAEATIANCVNRGSISYVNSKTVGNAKPNVGGIAATLARDASQCTNYGDIYYEGLFTNAGSSYASTCLGTTYASVGGCFGYVGIDSAGLTDCDNHGTVTARTYGAASNGSTHTAGGVFGASMSTTATYTNCDNDGKLDIDLGARTVFCGGVCGFHKATMTACTNNAEVKVHHAAESLTSDVTAIYMNVGGVVGYCYNTTTGCTNLANGSVVASGVGDSRIGGVIGMGGTGCQEVKDCINKASVSFTKTKDAAVRYLVAGVVGYLSVASNLTGCENYGNVSSTGSETTATIFSGGVVGAFAGSKVTDCKNSGNISVDGGGCTKIIYMGGVYSYNTIALTATGCTNSGNIVNTNSATTDWTIMGGIAGHYKKQPVLLNCSNTGNISSDAASKIRVGGLAGGSGSSIKNCSNDCTVTVSNATNLSQIGSAMGYFNGTDLDGCTFKGTLSSTNTASGAYVGGLFGAGGALTGTRVWKDFVVDTQVTTDCANVGYLTGYFTSTAYTLGAVDAPATFKSTCTINGVAIPSEPTNEDLIGSATAENLLTLANVVVE